MGEVDRFRLEAVIGTGGFATVYRAEDTKLGREVAVKVLHAHLGTDAGFLRRFHDEARAAAGLRHPNIVRIFDASVTDDGRAYLVMELLEGALLSELITQKSPVSVAETVAIVGQLASALDYLHGNWLVHRDLKPSNVMIDAAGVVTLMDFGIVRSLMEESHHTLPGHLVGTPSYMAPEQVAGGTIGAAADIYSLGIVVYELFAGRPPFQGNSQRVLNAQVHEPPPPLRGVPQATAAAVQRALEKDPSQRFATAGQFAAELLQPLPVPGADDGLDATAVIPQPPQSPALPLAPVTQARAGAATPTTIGPPPKSPEQPPTQPNGRQRTVLAVGIAAAALLIVALLGAGVLRARQGTNKKTASQATGAAAVQGVAGVRSAAEAVQTLAGTGGAGFADGEARIAQFNSPNGVTVDAVGTIYVADTGNSRIRKITAAGLTSTVAGSGGGQFDAPRGVAVDKSGNVYVADTGRNRIRKISADGGVATFAGSGAGGFADGQGAAAQFRLPDGIALDGAGNVYVADTGNNRIRKVTSDGRVSTVAGSAEGGSAGFKDGPATAARFNAPRGIAVDGAGTIYVADTFNQRIRKITPGGMVTTLAGSGDQGTANGAAAAARFSNPDGIAVDGSGNLYVADNSSFRIREITSAGVVITLAGASKEGFLDGSPTEAQFAFPAGVAVDGAGNVYVADSNNNCIRKITSSKQAP